MAVRAGDAVAALDARATQRMRAIDPLLPGRPAPEPGCGARFTALHPDGQPVAIAECAHWAGAPGSLDLTCGAARRFRLAPQIAGPDVAFALDQLLAQWRDHLAGVPEAGAADTAAIVTWPSRDVAGIRTLLRHGLAPLAVIAARTADRDNGESATGVAAPPEVRIRRAGPADVDAVADLGLALVRFDARFGAVIERSDTGAALQREAAGLLAGPAPWTWLAERDGRAVGLLAAEPPEAAAWIAPMAGRSPVAYVLLMFVLPGERGGGIGAALANEFHREIRAAAVPVALLHHAQANPLSAPFWSRQGYRPLWTSWEARPALALR